LVTVANNGALTLTGKLADGEIISQANSVSVNGIWPLFVNLYSGGQGGVLLGWVNYTSTSSNDLSGAVTWVKNLDTNATYYTNGFVYESTLEGSAFTAPASGESALNITFTKVVFDQGNLPWSTNSTFTFPVAPATVAFASGMVFLVDNATGLVSGLFSFDDGSVTFPLDFEGVVFQKTDIGRGCFLNSTNSSTGSMFLTNGP